MDFLPRPSRNTATTDRGHQPAFLRPSLVTLPCRHPRRLRILAQQSPFRHGTDADASPRTRARAPSSLLPPPLSVTPLARAREDLEDLLQPRAVSLIHGELGFSQRFLLDAFERFEHLLTRQNRSRCGQMGARNSAASSQSPTASRFSSFRSDFGALEIPILFAFRSECNFQRGSTVRAAILQFELFLRARRRARRKGERGGESGEGRGGKPLSPQRGEGKGEGGTRGKAHFPPRRARESRLRQLAPAPARHDAGGASAVGTLSDQRCGAVRGVSARFEASANSPLRRAGARWLGFPGQGAGSARPLPGTSRGDPDGPGHSPRRERQSAMV